MNCECGAKTKIYCNCGSLMANASTELFSAQCKIDAMTVASTGGLRDNKNKPRHSLVPTSTLDAIAEVIHKSSTEGGGKYPLHNWRKGLPWTDVADSASRHVRDFLDGKDTDKESGLHTLKHALTNLAFLVEYLETCPDMDNRRKQETK